MAKQIVKKKFVARRKKGFEMTSGLLQSRIREATEARGFSETRLLTHWSEVVGETTASMAVPVKVSYVKGGFGATLTVLTTGAFAPMLQAELPKIQNRVNAVYGYNAISRIHITQTAPTGFSKGRVQFEAEKQHAEPAPTPEVQAQAREISADIKDDKLRRILEEMANKVLTNSAEALTEVKQ